MSNKLIDPVHLFDIMGEPVFTNDRLRKEVAMLRKHNEILRRALKARLRRDGDKVPTEKPILH